MGCSLLLTGVLRFCIPAAMTLSDVCRDFQFDCGDGNCIRRSYMCDGGADCANGADEELTLCNPTGGWVEPIVNY